MRKNEKNSQKCKKMPKTSQKRPKKAKFKKRKKASFSGSKLAQQIDSGLKQLKMDLNTLKCIKIHIPQKGPKNAKNGKMAKNVRKLQIIAKFQKLLNMVNK